jgi:hypothetical protein
MFCKKKLGKEYFNMVSNSFSEGTRLPPVAIERLPSPWLDRNYFSTVKRICSQDEEFSSTKKSSMSKVVKELKVRGVLVALHL